MRENVQRWRTALRPQLLGRVRGRRMWTGERKHVAGRTERDVAVSTRHAIAFRCFSARTAAPSAADQAGISRRRNTGLEVLN